MALFRALWRLLRRVLKRKTKTILTAAGVQHEPPCGFDAITSEVCIEDFTD